MSNSSESSEAISVDSHQHPSSEDVASPDECGEQQQQQQQPSLTDENKDGEAKLTKQSSSLSTDSCEQALNSLASDDQDLKLKKIKPLESESEQRNTSTSNAGESEYESANEEDLQQYESVGQSETLSTDISSSCPEKQTEDNSIQGNTNDDIQNQKPQFTSESSDSKVENNYPQLDDSEENTKDEDDERIIAEKLKSVRRRRRNRLSDEDDDIEDFDEYSEEDECDEEAEDDDDSFDEADEGLLTGLSKKENSSQAEGSKLSLDDERENGDGQESESVDSKSAKSGQAKSAKKLEVEDKRHPQYIPRKGPFYEHDDRISEDLQVDQATESPQTTGESEENADKLKEKRKRKLKLCSDEMVDGGEIDQAPLSSKTSSKEQLEDTTSVVNNEVNDKTDISSVTDSKRDVRKKPIWDNKDKWSHDKFIPDDQHPKTREELISIYGYDIRNETEAPKLQRRSRYGKGPSKYVRRSDDDSAYAKKTLRKMIQPSKPASNLSRPLRSDDTRESVQTNSKTIAKKDQVFNHRNIVEKSTEHKPVSKESFINNTHKSTMPSKSIHNTNFTETNSRSHENRVFVNKVSSNKVYGKNDLKTRVNHDSSNKTNVESNHESNGSAVSNDTATDDKPKELFTNEDFPELVSTTKSHPASSSTAAATTTTTESTKSSAAVIYYQQASVKGETRPTSKDNNNHQVADTKKDNNSSEITRTANQSPLVVKSFLFENSRFTRPRNDYNVNWNNNNNINNNRMNNNTGKLVSSQQYGQQPSVKKPLGNSKIDTTQVDNEPITDSRPKRYSSIRQQRTQTQAVTLTPVSVANQPLPTSATTVTPNVNVTSSSVSQQQQPTTQRYSTMTSDTTSTSIITSSETSAKPAYFEQQQQPTTANANEIATAPSMTLLTGTPTALPHHHSGQTVAAHNYAPIAGPTAAAAATATGATYMSPATPLMAYYDPNSTTGQTAASAVPAPIGLAPAYFTTDQTGTTQPATNYFLTTADLATLGYHPAAAAYHLQANYSQSLAHHNHQSHVASRYLNTAPANTPSPESSRYLQTAPTTQNSASILVANQAYQPFPSGYPQFPPPAPSGATPSLGSSSPLPAGYPNVPLGGSGAGTVSNTPQQAPSGYSEGMYRGGATYYDIQSQQQQAIQRQLQQNMTQQQVRRKVITHHSHVNEASDGAETTAEAANAPVEMTTQGSKHANVKSEISVSN